MRLSRTFLIIVIIFFCAMTASAQKPLTKPEKPTQTTPAPKSSSSTTSGKSSKKSSSSSSSTQSSTSSSSSTQQSQTSSSSGQIQAKKPTTGYINGHEYVDLGLSVKWATCNVGASSPSDYGNYYAWGEIRTKSSYTPENSETYGKIMPTPNERVYELYNNLKNDNYDVKDYSDFKEKLSNDAARKSLYDNMKADDYDLPEYDKFSEYLGYGVWTNEEASSVAGSATYDAARANWGGTWRLPTASEIDELINKCKREWTTQGGHNGYKVTGPNGNSIFLPAAGWRYGTSLSLAGEGGDYWSATPDEDNTNYACRLYFYDSGFFRNWLSRYYGQSVRPVTE